MNQPADAADDSLDKERRQLFEFFKTFPFNKVMGMELLEAEPGRSRLSMSWREDLCQPAGILHGGAIASLADTAIAHAILLTPAGRESRAQGGGMVSVDLRIKYLRPVSSGKVFCNARVSRLGRQVIHAAATLTDSEGKEVAHGDSIYMIVTRDQLTKR
jgi:acyl-CoA thioesterase